MPEENKDLMAADAADAVARVASCLPSSSSSASSFSQRPRIWWFIKVLLFVGFLQLLASSALLRRGGGSQEEKSKDEIEPLSSINNSTLSHANATRTSKVVSTSSPFSPKEWGPYCDPRTIHTQYQPAQRVWIVSFAGWNAKRQQNLIDLKRSLAEVGLFDGRLHTLFFTETDLPAQYYDSFEWAFRKPNYRGFWTWKPWILRNLTETGLFAESDIVLWMDSDERLVLNDTTYFSTAICNMEHRNHGNYAGVFPFSRCYNHREADYTKPEVFERMGLDSDKYKNGEQIYAGSVGFRIVQHETLAFLREWEAWAAIPVMFGNDEDFSSRIRPGNGYQRHKNDQSVFSLMVRSRNMTTWPAPYYWRGDSGVQKNECLHNFQRAGYCFFFENKVSLRTPCRPFEQWLKGLPPPEV